MQWALGFFAAFTLGLSKAGLKGIGIICITSLALAFGARASTGLIVPLLIFADIFAVIYYNRHAQWRFLKLLLPWTLLGILLGVWVGRDMPEEVFKQGMAVIILISVAIMVYWEANKSLTLPAHWLTAGATGVVAGFVTMIGNLAGAFVNLYFLATRIPKEQFIGTAAWFFFITNLVKLPFHIWTWETVNWNSVIIDVYLIPVVCLGLWAGVKLIKVIPEKLFRKIVLVLTAIGAIIIFLR